VCVCVCVQFDARRAVVGRTRTRKRNIELRVVAVSSCNVVRSLSALLRHDAQWKREQDAQMSRLTRALLGDLSNDRSVAPSMPSHVCMYECFVSLSFVCLRQSDRHTRSHVVAKRLRVAMYASFINSFGTFFFVISVHYEALSKATSIGKRLVRAG
jgi:hypothetical protein